MATQVSGANSWLTINTKPLSFLPSDENEGLNIVEYRTHTIRITANAPDDLSILIDDLRLETASYGIWSWRPENYAGLYRLVVEAPSYQPQIAWVRVFPHKFSQHLYQKMQADLSAIAIDLLFRLDSPALERAKYTQSFQETSSLHDYKQIRGIIEKLRDIMLRICREPHRTLHQQNIQQDWQEISRFSDEISPLPGESIRLPEPLARQRGITYIPQYWTAQRTALTYDMYENRLLKQFLRKQLIAKLNIICERAEREKQRLEAIYARYRNSEDGETIYKLKHVITECQQMKQRCIRWSSEPFLKTVQSVVLSGQATQVLLKHPTYSRFYHLYLQFQQRLQTTLNTEHYVNELAMRKVSELYEMWSIFFISRIAIEELLAAGYQMQSNTTFYEVEKSYFQFDVRKNVASIMLFKDEQRVEFKYEPIYPNQSTVNQRSALVATIIGNYPLTPDMAIEVYEQDRPQQVLIFDAKYRWSRSHDGFFYPKQEDIDKMYRYRNNIQYKQYDRGKAQNSDIVTSAYILYPGNKIHSESKNRIGGLPLTPNLSSQRLDDIREQLKDLLYYAYLID